jgi:hypothetical protein
MFCVKTYVINGEENQNHVTFTEKLISNGTAFKAKSVIH